MKTKLKKPKSVDPKIYDKNYLLKYCGGYDEFSKSQANYLPQRLARCVDVANFQKRQKILDIGCGRGEIAYHAARKGCIVFAIDYSKDAINITSKLISKLPKNFRGKTKVKKMDAKDLHFPKNYFDQIIMTDVIEHLYPWEVEIVTQKCYRILKSNGRLIINTSPNVWFSKLSYPIIRSIKTLTNLKDPGEFFECYGELHVFEQSPLTLKNILKDFKIKIWGENFTQALWLNKIPLLNLFASSLFAIATKKE